MKKIAISPGDLAGVGPDICIKAFKDLSKTSKPVFFGDPNLFEHRAKSLNIDIEIREYEGEDDSILPPSVRKQAEDVEEKRVNKLSTEPASADDVLKALAKEMEAAKAEAAFLRQELDETRDKVKGLEIELDEKKVELESIQEITKNMEKIVEDNKSSGDKELSLQDSVMVGDNLFNGDKIDKQIINDPEAIARAAIEAYREGRKDSGKIDLDFD